MKKLQNCSMCLVVLVVIVVMLGVFVACTSTPVVEKPKAEVTVVEVPTETTTVTTVVKPKVVVVEKPVVVEESIVPVPLEVWNVKGFSVSMNGKVIMDSISGQGMPALDKSYEATIALYAENVVKLNVTGLGDVVTGTYDLQDDGWVRIDVDYLNEDVLAGLLDLLNLSMPLGVLEDGYWFKLEPGENMNYVYAIANAYDRNLLILAVPAM